MASEQLPPCKDCLQMHAKRANYQALVWRKSLQNFPDLPPPEDGHGWTLDDEGNLAIKWMSGSPAPDMIMELLACRCSRSCTLPDCQCLVHGLRCTATCKLQNCSTMPTEEEENLSNNHSDEDTDDDDDDDNGDV